MTVSLVADRCMPFRVRTSCGHVVIRKMREGTAGRPYDVHTIIEAPNGAPCMACEARSRGSIVQIGSNGSKWTGEENASIEMLLMRLEQETLDPRFEHYGNFVQPLPASELVMFWGNFGTYSHLFDIKTNDATIIATLSKRIESNKKTAAYKTLRSNGFNGCHCEKCRPEKKGSL